MANLTLSVDDDLLQRARETALHEHTNINTLVSEYLVRYVDAKNRRIEAIEALDKLANRNHSRSTESWSRDGLHSGVSG